MQTSELFRHRTIESLLAQHSENVPDAAVDLWEKMSTQIISIVGEGGFTSLYARSLHLTQSAFPWLADSSLSPPADQRFKKLKISFEGQTPAQATEANRRLLTTFTDILASLVGEQLTTRILRSAWGVDAQDRTSKEQENE